MKRYYVIIRYWPVERRVSFLRDGNGKPIDFGTRSYAHKIANQLRGFNQWFAVAEMYGEVR